MKLRRGTSVAVTLTGIIESIGPGGVVWIETVAGTSVAWRPGLDAQVRVTRGKKRILDHAPTRRRGRPACRCGWRAPKPPVKHRLDPYTWHLLRELRRAGVAS